MEAQHPGARVFSCEMFAHDARPHAPRGAKFRDLLQKAIVRREEEREAGSEAVDVETSVDGRLDVGHAVGQRECHFLHGGAAGFPHVIAGDGNRVPVRHLAVAEGEQVSHDAHGMRDGINIRSARDVFLQDVVLDGARNLPQLRAGPLGDRDV